MRLLLFAFTCSLLSCADDSPAKKAAPAAADPCVAVRAEFFSRMSYGELHGLVAGSGAIDPLFKVMQDNFKLDHPTCFF